MKTADYILSYLSEKGSVQVPLFGEFFLDHVAAHFDTETKKFLPPAKKVSFRSDYLLQSDDLAAFISQKENTPAEDVKSEITKLTDFWKQKLAAGEDLEITGLGRFLQGETLGFTGNRIEKSTPDYYGLEEISLSEIGKPGSAAAVQNNQETAGDYKLNRSILWLFLLIIPVGAMIYLAITQQERIFGNKSFDDLSVTNSTHRITPKPVPAVDSTAIKKADSIRQDSIKNAAIPVVKKATAKKKYTNSKNRKYTRNKWSKPKKRANR